MTSCDESGRFGGVITSYSIHYTKLYDYDHSYVYRLTGVNALDAQEQLGLAGAMRLSGPRGLVDVEYRPTDTVGDLVRRINDSGADVTARLTSTGALQLRAKAASDGESPDFVIHRNNFV